MADKKQKWQEIANRGLQDKFDPETRAKFDEAVSRGLITMPDAATAEPEPQAQHSVTMAEKIASNPLVRGAMGVASIPLSLAQSLANVVDPDGAGQYVNDHLDKLENMKRRGMEARGTEYDMLGTAGEIAAPMGALGKMPIATNLLGKVAQGSAIGGVLGGTQPITNSDDYEGDRLSSIKTGAAAGAAVPVAVAGGKAVIGGAKGGYNYVKDAATPYIKANTGRVDELAGKAIRDLIGPEKYNSVKAALLRNENPLAQGTAGEVAVGANSTGLSKLQQAASSGDDYISQIDAKNLARVNAMKGISGSKDDVIEAEMRRASISTPLRDQALGSAKNNTSKISSVDDRISELQGVGTNHPVGGVGTRSVPDAVREAAKLRGEKAQVIAGSNRQSTPFGARIPKQYTPHQTYLGQVDDAISDAAKIETLKKSELEMMKFQKSSFEAHGIEGASGNPIVKGIGNRIAAAEGDVSLQGILRTIQKNISSMVNTKTGAINPDSLYTFRKTGLDKTMKEYSTKLGDPSSSGVMKDVSAIKGMVDDVIEKASGGGWKRYLKAYGDLSRPLERLETGKMLRDGVNRQVGGNARQVAKAFDDKIAAIPAEMSKKTGFNRSELSRLLDGDDMQQVGRVRADMGRDARVAELAGKGKANIDVDMQKLPNALIREVMVINNILSRASVGVQDKAAKEVSRLLLADPKKGFTELVELMDKFPPKEKNKFLQMIAEETPMTAEMLKRVGYVTAGTQAGEL